MNRFMKFDENNISKVIVKFSFILVSAIAISLVAIYTPKYYFEYKNNTESTKQHLNRLFEERLRYEVNETVENIDYRSSVHEKYLMLDLESEVYKLYETITEDFGKKEFRGISEKKDLFYNILKDFSCSDSLKYYFIADKNHLIMNSKNKVIEKNSDFTGVFGNTLSENPSFNPELQSVFTGILNNGENYIKIKFSKLYKIYYGVILPRSYFNKELEDIVHKEIEKSNIKGSQEYIFVYKLLKPEGGKDFARMIINPNRPDLVGELLSDDYKDSTGFEFRKEFLRQINLNGEALVKYFYNNPELNRLDLKTSYFKLYPDLQWIIAQGYYEDHITKIVAVDEERYRKDFIVRVSMIIVLVFLFLTFYYFIFRSFSRKIQETIIKYRSDLEEKNKLLSNEIGISNQKQKELSEFNEYISKLYESIPVGIVLIETSTKKIVNINNSGLEMLGYERDELIGRVCNFTFCTSVKNKCPIIDLNQNIDNSERNVLHKSGKNVTVLKKACMISIKSNDFVLESFIDITKIKETEAELIKMKEKAEQASFEKSRFLANMSHEIRTPMNSIYGMSTILCETELSKEQADIVETIKASSDILVRILNDILDLSRIESGKINIEKANFDLNQLVNTIVHPFELKFRSGKVIFTNDFNSNIHNNYLGDSLKIGQILNNLLSNAVKFTSDGTVRLETVILRETEKSAVIGFIVTDTGIGIEEKSLEKIFERFTQADISTTRKYGGTGLGLTISKKLAELLGGELTVKSKPGIGSEFFFRIELEKTHENQSVRKSVIDLEQFADKMKSINILVAEDNQLNQKYISTLLKRKSANFKIVENGKQVLDELNLNKYDIILMDGQMPEMDGINTTMAIRSSEAYYRSIPIIALTASALLDDKNKFLEAGMNDYLSKPIDQDALFHTIFKYCFPELSLQIKEPEFDIAGMSDGSWEIIDKKDFDLKVKTLGKKVFIDILELLVKEIPNKIAVIGSAFEANDIEKIKFEAHSLKGIALNFSAAKFNDLCVDLDNAVNSGSIERSEAVFKELKTVSEKYLVELYRIIKLNKTDFQNIKS
jgi:PAS domain S-box-containing protein